MATKVTLCVFCHNQEPFVRQALDGAFRQDHSDLEIIITDDGSTDGTFALVNSLAGQYRGPHRVLVRRNPVGLGLAESINEVMRLVTGEFIVIAAGDDVSYPSRCRMLVDAWLRHDRKIHVVHGGFRRIDQTGESLPLTAGELKLQSLPQPLIQRVNLEDGIRTFAPYVFGCTAAWDRSVFDLFGPLKSRVVQEDVVLGMRGSLSGGVLFLPQQLVDYRLHTSNIYHINFQISDTGIVRNEREFEQLEAFKLRNLRFKDAVHDNFQADVSSAARAGLLAPETAAALTEFIRRQRIRTESEIALRSGGLVARAHGLLGLWRLDRRVNVRETARLLPRPLYRQSRIWLQSRQARSA